LSRSLTPSPAVPAAASPDSSAPVRREAARTTERFTVDLTPDLNDALSRWAQQAKRRVGRRIPKTEVARALIELLLEDPSLASQVHDRLKARE
jgi:hypothetical protein